MNVYLKEGRLPTESNDCSVIALAYACDLDYKDAHSVCKKRGRKNNKGFSLVNVFRHDNGYSLKEKEFKLFVIADKKFTVTYYGRPKMSVGKFKKHNPVGTFIIRVGGHLFCMKDGEVLNQTNDRDKISYYHKINKH